MLCPIKVNSNTTELIFPSRLTLHYFFTNWIFQFRPRAIKRNNCRNKFAQEAEEKGGGPRMRAGYLQQDLFHSRKMIKWSTPTTRMDTVQTRQNSGLNDGEKNRYNVKKN